MNKKIETIIQGIMRVFWQKKDIFHIKISLLIVGKSLILSC